MPPPCQQTADTMPHGDAIGAARALHRPVIDGEYDPFPLLERHHFDAGLQARSLLGQDEFAAGEVNEGAIEKEGDLQRKMQLAIQILMKTVIIPWPVAQKQWRRAALTLVMTKTQEPVEAFR